MEAVFLAIENGFFIECYSFRRVETQFFSSALLFRTNFVLVLMESILSPTIGNHFLCFYIYILYIYIYIPVGESSFSAHFFLTNRILNSGWWNHNFSTSRKDFLETSVPLDRKKTFTGRSP